MEPHTNLNSPGNFKNEEQNSTPKKPPVINTTVRYCLVAARMAAISETRNNKCW